ncbi:MAG TPA: transposase [Steroidobacteraceae bacterium]|nr:transposase [Steroidobacteraceae bacterium]
MPRLPRLHVPGGFYHVTLRGNHREDIFDTPEDRVVLNNIVAESIAKYGVRVHAFCWMTNHTHTLYQIGDTRLGKLVQRITTQYSRYRHKKLVTRGHLFEKRHGAWIVDTDAYMLALLRYIHLNPVSAGMVTRADHYAWSSHRAYLGLEAVPWLTIDLGLSMFGSTIDVARSSYSKLVHGELYASEERLFEREVHPEDPRVIGGDKFLATLAPYRFVPKSRLTLDQLASLVCEQMSVSLADLRSPFRGRTRANARAELAARALEGRIASLHEVGRFLDKNPSSLSRLLDRRRRRM